jgi:hypothetical protein
MSPSFASHVNINPTRTKLQHLLVQNVVAGNTIVMNRPTYELVRPIPAEATMHDHWVALVASVFGVIEYETRSTVLYRQHRTNAVGVRLWSLSAVTARAFSCLAGGNNELVAKKAAQARAVHERFGFDLSERHRRLLSALSILPELGRAQRIGILLDYGVRMDGLLRTLGLFYSAAMVRRAPSMNAEKVNSSKFEPELARDLY